MNDAAVEWIKLARAELNTIAIDDLSFKAPRFSWQSAAATVASPWDATSTVSAVWRGLAKRAFESVAILSKWKVDESQRRTVTKHVAALANSIELVPKTARTDLEPRFKNFAVSFAAAAKRQSCTWLLSLCKLAKKKAEQLEAEILSAKRALETGHRGDCFRKDDNQTSPHQSSI